MDGKTGQMPERFHRNSIRPAASLAPGAGFATLRRKCACSGSSSLGGRCESCRKKEALRRSSKGQADAATVPPIVLDVLQSPGQPVDGAQIAQSVYRSLRQAGRRP